MKNVSFYWPLSISIVFSLFAHADSLETKEQIPMDLVDSGRFIEDAIFGASSIEADVEFLKTLDVAMLDNTAETASTFDGKREFKVYFRNSDDSCRVYLGSRITDPTLLFGYFQHIGPQAAADLG